MRAITSIRTDEALAVPGVRAILSYEDAPAKLYSTARHEHPIVDPDDTAVLDRVVRFIGQRVAGVIADDEAAAEEGCRKLAVEYEVLPAVFDPEDGHAAGRPGHSRQGTGSPHPRSAAQHCR